MNSLALLREICGKVRATAVATAMLAVALASPASSQTTAPARITLDEAIQMALQHNHNLLAARTTIQQSEAEETTANLRPNPSLFADWDYLPLNHSSQNAQYLHDSTEADIGLSYLLERGLRDGGRRRGGYGREHCSSHEPPAQRVRLEERTISRGGNSRGRA